MSLKLNITNQVNVTATSRTIPDSGQLMINQYCEMCS